MQRWITGVLLLVALAAAACGKDAQRRALPATTTTTSTAPVTSTTDGGGEEPVGPVLTVVGKNIVWEPTTLSAPAGVEVTIRIDNQDTGIPHNFHLTAPGAEVHTEIEPGPKVQEAKFKIDQAGTYPFVCDVHPTMKGDLRVG